MPIGREAERLYPGGSLRSAEWLAIRAAILGRAGGRCECRGECGEAGHATDVALSPLASSADRCDARQYEPHPITGSRVVLTVAHLDHDPGHNAPSNLRAMCQRCHNRYDMPHRRANARLTRRARYATGDLFDAPPAPPRGDGGRL